MKYIIKNTILLSFVSLFIFQTMYVALEPTITVAATDDDTVVVTLNVDSGISITDGANTTMLPNIGMNFNKAVGESSWNVKTNNDDGYTLAVKASASPALVNGIVDHFDDYTEATPATPDIWSGVAVGTKEFGFSARGTHSLASFGSSSTCGDTGSGEPDAATKYLGFETGNQTIATSTEVTTTSGVDTYICFAAEQNGTYASSGTYTATITATATTN